MRPIISIFRFLFRFFLGLGRTQRNPSERTFELNSSNQPPSSIPPLGAQSLGQMEKQVAAMVQIPISARSVKVQFSSVAQDGVSSVMSEADVITPDGIHAEKTHHLIITSSGHVTKASGIRVKCGVCGQFDSTLHRCSEPTCRLPLCELHAIVVEVGGEKICYCPVHAEQAQRNRDNWKEHWLEQERRRDASGSA